MNVVFLDCTQNYGYQYSAANTKTELLARGLTCQGDKCRIVNSVMGYGGINERETKCVDGVGDVITYTSHSLPELSYVTNLKTLYQDLKKHYKAKDKNILVLETQYVHIYFTYIILGRMIGYKIAVISHEWLPIIRRKHFVQNVSAKLYGRFFGVGVHAILPISHYITERIKHFQKAELLTPVLADFPDSLERIEQENTIVYCVQAYYRRVIDFVIDSYELYLRQSEAPLNLTLILNGPNSAIESVAEFIKSKGLDGKIQILTKLPYRELINKYKSAKALLIPLDPNNGQDQARFSQKIAEYLSTGVPVITNNVGEIPYYFKNRESMLICDYSKAGFSESFKWIQENSEKARKIGYEGYIIGKDKFDYKKFGKTLHDFLIKL
ncbi:MAG: glycosyltransferase [Muribaculum sp.]|nr:glycosyltransferase [Muribaculum sp.]